jgi:uncharacterized protein YbjT (DUF2867 family)
MGMAVDADRTVVVTGATGRQGGAAARHLLASGWHVRALTRDPSSERARALGALGAEVLRSDIDDSDSLLAAFRGAHGVYSVQNSAIAGTQGELRQGKVIADAAQQAGIRHFVYASGGPGVPGTGVLQWDLKLEIEAYLRDLGLPTTILRPTALMELMTDPAFFPAASTWHVMPKLAGGGTPIPWVAAHDIGAIAALAFAAPEQFIGRELRPAGDVQSVDACRAVYRRVMGKGPRRFPMPVWLLESFAGRDLTRMWRWLRVNVVRADPAETRALLPAAFEVESWLREQRGGQRAGA